MEKSPYKLNLLHYRQNHKLFMKRNERENKKNKENAVRLTPPPPYQLRPFFLRLGCLSPPSLLLHVVYRGVPKWFPLTKILGIQLLKNLSNLLFLCRSAPIHFRNTFCQKMRFLFSSVINPRILFPFFLLLQFFHPSSTNANYLCRRIFGTSLLTLFGVSLVLWRGVKADNERSNPVLLPLVPEFTNIWISHLQFLHF